MYCRNCGSKLRDNMAFCDACGTPVKENGVWIDTAVSEEKDPDARGETGERPARIAMILSPVFIVLVGGVLAYSVWGNGLRLRVGNNQSTNNNSQYQSGGTGKAGTAALSSESEETEATPTPVPTATPTPTPTPVPTTVSSENTGSDGGNAAETSQYIIDGSDSRYISADEVAGLSAEELRLARNEIFARHGRKFKDANLQAYFNAKPWYTPSIEADDFNTDTMLNEYEKANIKVIEAAEANVGTRQTAAATAADTTKYITVINGIQAPASDFLIPDSSSRYITNSDLSFLDGEDDWSQHLDSQSAINEIYARYGYAFYSDSPTAEAIRQRLNGKTWYEEAKQYCPVARGDNYTLKQNYMNDYERANIQFIWDWQKVNDAYYTE